MVFLSCVSISSFFVIQIRQSSEIHQELIDKGTERVKKLLDENEEADDVFIDLNTDDIESQESPIYKGEESKRGRL